MARNYLTLCWFVPNTSATVPSFSPLSRASFTCVAYFNILWAHQMTDVYIRLQASALSYTGKCVHKFHK